MSDIKVFEKTKTEIVKKQILVVDCGDSLLTPEQRKYLREGILRHMQSGLVVLPGGCHAFTCDADAAIVMEDEQ